MAKTEKLLQRIAELERETGIRRTLFAACPNSTAVIKAAFRAAKRNNAPIYFAATLNQIDCDGGYTGMRPDEFVKLVRMEAAAVNFEGIYIVAIDHGGPWLKDKQRTEKWSTEAAMDGVKRSFEAALLAGYDLIHVDPTVDINVPAGQTIDIRLVAARTVELIFRLRIQGLCNSAIADRLNGMGVLSPMEYKQAQGFNYSCGFRSNEQAEWSPMLVKRILSNEIYIGTLIQHKSGTPNHKIKKRVEYDRDEWIVIENNHEPIICRSDFDTVQNLMLRDVRTAPKQEKVHLFSGFVFCGDCKHTMVRKTVPSGGKKYHYLVCSTNKAGRGCSPHTFSEDKLKSIVLRVVNDHIELIAQVEQVLDYIASLPEQERRIINYDAQMTALENEIKRYQDLKINLYSDMADGVISREEYKEFHAGYDRRIADRQRQLGKLKDERSQAMENSSGNIEWIEQFKKYRHLTELDRECIVHLIEKILIYDGKRIEVCFRYKDELENALQYIERFENVLPAEEGVTIPERRNA